MSSGDSSLFAPLHAFLSERTGSLLSPQQRTRIEAALSAEQRAMPPDALISHLRTPQAEGALQQLMAAASVNKTDLFRDEVQLSAFFEEVLCPMVSRHRRPLHVWSAGCSTGEEVATLLVLLSEAGAAPGSCVLGTDISGAALERAKRLAFHPDVMRRVSADRQARYFERHGAEHRLKPALAQHARFAWHNLMDAPYPRPDGAEGFDVIFCRNVLIYFSEPAFDLTVERLTQQLAPGGVLVLSAAEPILRPARGIEVLRRGQAFFYTRSGKAGEAGGGHAPAEAGFRLHPSEPSRPARAAAFKPAPARRAPAPALAQRRALLPSDGEGGEKAGGEDNPLEEAKLRFQRALEWASAGRDSNEVERGLRQSLYLDPELAQARYLLAVLLEEREARSEAKVEYRRALAALEQGKVRAIPFFLNAERLKSACAQAVRRLGGEEG